MCANQVSIPKSSASWLSDNGALALHHLSSHFAALSLAIILASLLGCASLPPPPKTEYQAMLGKVAITTSMQVPEIKLAGFTQSKSEGAASEVGNAFAACLEQAHEPLGAILCSIFVAPVGAVIGAVRSPRSETIEAAKANISASLEAKVIQETLRSSIMAAALANNSQLIAVTDVTSHNNGQTIDYRPLIELGVDTVLEVSLVKIGFVNSTLLNDPDIGIMKDLTLTELGSVHSEIDPLLTLGMLTHIRLSRTKNNEELFSANYIHYGGREKLAGWAANQAKRFVDALNAGYQALGTHIYESVLQLYPFPEREGATFSYYPFLHIPVEAYGLAPRIPTKEANPTLESLQPTLRWQPFPRLSDVIKSPEDMKRVNNVRYDLVIAKEYNGEPTEIIYRRNGLPNNKHKIEDTLDIKTGYFWSVRARFELDGHQRVTEWSSSSRVTREHFTTPNRWSYRFCTP